MRQWRVYADEPAPGVVEIGLERVSVRRRWLRRTIGPRHLEVDIARERLFDPDDVAESAAHAEELRAVAEDENEAYWAAAHDATARASDRLAEARQRAHDAAELSRILRSQGESG
jgi:hypothetical protein